MNVEQMNEWIAAGLLDEIETAWLEAMETADGTDIGAEAGESAEVLKSLVEAGHADAAETLAWTYLADRIDRFEPADALQVARAVVSAVPASDELRSQAAQLYRAIYDDSEHLDAILRASGLPGGQSPRRAFRTLDTCLAIQPGCFLANRFDGGVLRAGEFQDALGEFELTDSAGSAVMLDPKALADEYEITDETDFRVLIRFRREDIARLLEDDPASVLIGLCTSGGDGRIDAVALKEALVPEYLPKDKWPGWWNRARTAAKRCEKLSLEGRHPIVVSYHPRGRSLEEELAGAARRARTPLEHLAVLRQYLREARHRKVEVSEDFAGPIVEALAEQGSRFLSTRPVDSLTAALAVGEAIAANLPAPKGDYPSVEAILATAERPEEAIAQLANAALFPAAIDALCARLDAPDRLAGLLRRAPLWQLDEVAARLAAAGREGDVAEAARDALTAPAENIQLCLWLWKGPASTAIPDELSRLQLLTRLIGVLEHIERDWDADPARRKKVRQDIRSALSAQEFAAFRQALAETDEGVAATLKRRIERLDGLAQAVREEMLNALRESFPRLFFVAKAQPWEDESVIWATRRSLDRHEAKLKELIEVKMPANSRAIGAAAEHGDLSENSEWKFAIEEQRMLKAQAAKIENELASTRILDPEHVPTETVGIGSRVTLRHVGDDRELQLTFLGPWDADVSRRIFSYQTPLAKEFMGKGAGDTATVRIEGLEGEYRIESIDSAIE